MGGNSGIAGPRHIHGQPRRAAQRQPRDRSALCVPAVDFLSPRIQGQMACCDVSAPVYRTRAGFLYVDEMDLDLHRARIDRGQRKITLRASLKSLPDGCFVEIERSGYLVWGDMLFLWSPAAYICKIPRPVDSDIAVLTPEPIVRCLRKGYRPQIHHSLVALLASLLLRHTGPRENSGEAVIPLMAGIFVHPVRARDQRVLSGP